MPKDALSLYWCLGYVKSANSKRRRRHADDASADDSKHSGSQDTGEIQSDYQSDASTNDTSDMKKDVLLRVDMDPTGLDPNRGAFVRFSTVRTHLTRMLLTGLPPEGLSIFIRQACNVSSSPPAPRTPLLSSISREIESTPLSIATASSSIDTESFHPMPLSRSSVLFTLKVFPSSCCKTL